MCVCVCVCVCVCSFFVLTTMYLNFQWGNSCIVRVFRRLTVPLCLDKDKRGVILGVAVHLHNARARYEWIFCLHMLLTYQLHFVSLCPSNQIRTVFSPGYLAPLAPAPKKSAFHNPIIL